MNIHEFVAQTLENIVTAVTEAKKAHPHAIAQKVMSGDAGGATILRSSGGMFPTTLVEFDIAVTVESDSKIEGHVKGPIITVIGAGVEGGHSRKNASISRIKFTVPVTFS